MADKNKKYTNKNLKAERSTTDTFYSKQKPIFRDSQSPYTASIFSNEGDTPELNWAIQHMEPFSSIKDAYGIYDAARRGDRADLNKSIFSQIIPFLNYSDIELPKEVKDAVNRTEAENKEIILKGIKERNKKAYGGTLDPSRGKEFTEDRTARGYYYYLGESNKSKLLDKLALAKSRLTPYAEGGFIEEEEDGPGTPKKSPAPKKAGIDKELLIRQQFKESSFDPKAKSGANARGLAQIMDEVEQDAKKAGILKKGEDIYNPEVNTRVQKWYMDNLYNSSFINKPGQKEDVKIAKALAAYNYGRGNVLKHLNEKKAAGVDIYNSFDWLKGLPTETTDYVNKILRKTDPKFEKQYNEAVKTYKYKAEGGWLETYATGGPTKNVSPKVINDYQKYLKAKKAYDDSAQAYNTGKKVYQDIGKSLDERYGLEDSYEKYFTQNYDAGKLKYPVEGTRGKMYASKTNRPYTKKDLQREIDLYKAFEAISSDPAEKKMYNEHVSNMSNLLNLKVRPTATAMSTEVPSIMFFKKPVQPVEFREGEEQPVQEQVSSSTSIEPTNKGLRVTKDARNTYYWSDGVPLTKDEYNRRLTANKATGGWLEEYAKGGDTKTNTLEGDLISKVIMNRNKNKDFVQRANALGMYPESNMFSGFDPEAFGNKMSHKMVWGEDESGQAYMYPSVYNPGNEDIKVPNQYADYISSEGYKKASGMEYAKGGELIKRADGSYSRRGLWDNIRANKGSGKKPTKEMLEQEAKIKAEYAEGGDIKSKVYTDYNKYLKAKKEYDDSMFLYNATKGHINYLKNLEKQNKVKGVNNEWFDFVDDWSGKYHDVFKNIQKKNFHAPFKTYETKNKLGYAEEYKKPVQPVKYKKSENSMKKTEEKPVVTKTEEKPVNVETPTESAPFKPNKFTYTDNANTYYWYQKTPSTTIPVTKEEYDRLTNVAEKKAKGGYINLTTPDGEKHIIYKKESPTGNGKGKKGNIMVTHPTKDKGKWDTIDLTDITDGEVKTVAEGKKSTLKWHKENPETKAKGGWLNNYK